MTVCVAAMCSALDGTVSIVGASDRMVTAGDVLFEPGQSKLWELTTSIVAMTAGDSLLQTEILFRVRNEITNKIQEKPSEWLFVKDVAASYARHYQDIRKQSSEATYLAPLGLHMKRSFLSRAL